MENPLKMDDLGVPPFKETSIYDLTPNGGLVRDIPLFQGKLGW